MDTNWIERRLTFLPMPLRREIIEKATEQSFAAGDSLLQEGQYVKVIPLVRRGLIKVGTRFEDRDLLLYYIQQEESCVMSFAAMLEEIPSQVYALAEEDTEAILLPARLVRTWLRTYPSFHQLFYRQYNKRYSELLQTIHHLLFNRMDERLYDHLREKARLRNTCDLNMSHRQLADELGTAREVISRVMKKLESEGKVQQLKQGVVRVLPGQ